LRFFGLNSHDSCISSDRERVLSKIKNFVCLEFTTVSITHDDNWALRGGCKTGCVVDSCEITAAAASPLSPACAHSADSNTSGTTMFKAVLLIFALGTVCWAQGGRDGPDYKFSQLELDLMKKLLDSEPDSSVTFSPLSIRALLAMVKEGTKGQTERTLGNALGETRIIQNLFAYPPRGGIKMGNVFYLRNNLEIVESFKEKLTSSFKAEFQYADFSHPKAAAYNANEWVKRITNKQITDLLDPSALNAETTFLMINAIHLAAKWKDPFEREETSDGVFWENSNGKLKATYAPIMHRKDYYRLGSVESLNARVLEIPFKIPERHAMYIVLPNDPNGLRAMVDKMTPGSLKDIMGSVRGPIDLYLWMPQFQAATTKNLRSFLPSNVGAIFESSADVTGITPGKNVKLNDVLHKAVLKVDEEGATGSAASGIHDTPLANIPPVYFNATHPFMYFISEQAPDKDGREQFYRGPSNVELYFMGFVGKLDEAKPLPANWGQLAEKGPYQRNRPQGSRRRKIQF